MILPTKTTTVYSGPGYPVDPAKEMIRQLRGIDSTFCCVMLLPTPEHCFSEIGTLLIEQPKTARGRARLFAKRFLRDL